ncbi:substrate-binding domain-containing protein [Pseudomonas sp. NPDC007930]|uniref:LacI family DNA-binding transcriptional regulator n=1 Tax=Pseudomonas sp. NPDC007930 TaxID=3364417 RepID=UPI0036E7D25F
MSDTPTTRPAPRVRRSRGGVTLSDVAREAGVALMTASRALNKPHMVSAELVERVKAAVVKTGYVANLLASGLASAQSFFVAVLVPNIASLMYLEFLQTLRSELAQAGYQVILGENDYDDAQEAALIETLVARRPDAIVLVGTARTELGRQRLAASGIPVVETWDLCAQPVGMLVGFSQAGVGRAVAGYLLDRGYRRLALINADDPRAAQRAEGFRAAVGERFPGASLPAQVIKAPSSLGAGRQALGALLDQHPGLQAVFCTSDMVALGALTEARARGIQVPEQLAIIGYGDLNFAADTEPSLTTVRADGRAIALGAAQLVVRHCRGERDCAPVNVGFEIIRRASA